MGDTPKEWFFYSTDIRNTRELWTYFLKQVNQVCGPEWYKYWELRCIHPSSALNYDAVRTRI